MECRKGEGDEGGGGRGGLREGEEGEGGGGGEAGGGSEFVSPAPVTHLAALAASDKVEDRIVVILFSRC